MQYRNNMLYTLQNIQKNRNKNEINQFRWFLLMLQKIFSYYSSHLDQLFYMNPTLETAADGLFSSFLLPRTLSNLLQLSEEQHLPWVNAEKKNNYDGSESSD